MPESGSRAFFVVNLLMLQLRIYFCRKCCIYALFVVKLHQREFRNRHFLNHSLRLPEITKLVTEQIQAWTNYIRHNRQIDNYNAGWNWMKIRDIDSFLNHLRQRLAWGVAAKSEVH